MHPVLAAIHQRRSVRPGAYTDQPVARAAIERLVAAANAAPSHKKTYPWRFVVFDTASAKTELGEFLAERQQALSDTPVPKPKLRITRERPGKAAAAVAIVMNPALDRLPEWEEVSATAAAVQNFWLALGAEGLAGYWSSPGTLTAGAEEFLGLAPGERCLGMFYLGYAADAPAPIDRPAVAAKVEWR